jgi:cell division protein FtsB
MIRTHKKTISTQSLLFLGAILLFDLYLLVQLVNLIQKSQRNSETLITINKQNEDLQKLITEKKKQLKYLNTKERLEKDAKTIIGKKVKGENVLIFVEEAKNLVPIIKKESKDDIYRKLSNPQKWLWIFTGQKINY